MKNLKLFGLLLALMTLTIISCDNAGSTGPDADGTDTTATQTTDEETAIGTMTAAVAGSAWSAADAKAMYEGDMLVITGTGADGSKIRLEVGEKADVGIFPIRRGKLQNASYTKASGANAKYHCPFNNTSGVINIDLINEDKVDGSFSFNGSNFSEVISIEEGHFSLPIGNKPTL